MKNNCEALKLSIKICLVSFFLICLFILLLTLTNFDNKYIEIILNIIIGVFGSGCVSLFLCIPAYFNSKTELLNEFMYSINNITMKIYTIKYLRNEFDNKNTIDYLNYLRAKRMHSELFDNLIEPKDKKIKDRLIEEYIENISHDESNKSKDDIYNLASNYIDNYIENLKNKSVEIYKKYIEISQVDLFYIKTLIYNMQFFSGEKLYNKIMNEIYLPLCEFLACIDEPCKHFSYYMDVGKNDVQPLIMLFELQKKVFSIDNEMMAGVKIEKIKNNYYSKIMHGLESLSSIIYKNKKNDFKDEYISYRMIYQNK